MVLKIDAPKQEQEPMQPPVQAPPQPAMPAQQPSYNVLDEKPATRQRDLAPKELKLASAKPSESGLPADMVQAYREQFGKPIDEEYADRIKEREQAKTQKEMEQFALENGVTTPQELELAKQQQESGVQGFVNENLRTLYNVYKMIEPAADAAGAVAKDIGTGVTTDFKHIAIGGPVRAVNSAIALVDELAVWLNNNIADLRVGGDTSKPMKPGDHSVKLPNVSGDPKSYTGAIGRSVTQFVTGFAAMPVKAASFGGQVAKAAATDFAFFDGQEGNLANLIKDLGGKGNVVVEFLATDKETPELIGRLKNAVAGSVTDVAFAGFLQGLRVMRQMRKAKELAGVNTHKELEAKVVANQTAEPPADVGAKVDQLLGGSNADEVVRIEGKLKHVHVEVPLQVAAKGLDKGAYRFPDVANGNVRYYAVAGAKEAQEGKVLTYSRNLDEVRSKVGEGDRLVYADVPKADADQWAEVDRVLGRRQAEDPHTMQARLAPAQSGPQLGKKPPPLPELENTKDIINWSKFNSQDDVLTTVSRMAEGQRAEIKTAQRGKRSNIRTVAAAGDENAWELLTGKRRADSSLAMNAEEQYALRQLWASSGEKLTELARAAQTGDQETLFAFRRMLTIHNTIQQAAMGVRTETARALQQWAIPAGSSADKLRQIQLAVESSGGEYTTRRIAESIAVLANTQSPEVLENFIRKSWQAKSADAVREYFINSILSGPKTHVVNMLSNSLVMVNSLVERQLAGAIGEVLDPVTGVKAIEGGVALDAMVKAHREMFRWAYHRMKIAAKQMDASKGADDPFVRIGRDKLDTQRTRAISSENMDIDPATPWGRAVDMVGSIVNIPGSALGAADTYFKTINYRMELHASAARRALSEVEQGLLKKADVNARIADIIDDPPRDLITSAENSALINTFTNDPNRVAKALMGFRDALDYHSSRSIGLPSGSILIPFVNTPANILSYTFDRTPLAPIGAKFRADVAAGGARRNLALARVGLGSTVMATFYSLALDGNISGGGPEGDSGWRKRATLRRNGWQPYSIRLQTGTNKDGSPQYRWFAYNRMDPVGMYIGFAADLAEFARNNDSTAHDSEIGEIAAAAAMGVARNVTDKSYFTGVARTITATQEPHRYSERYLNGILSTIIPAGVKQWAMTQDPVARHTWDLMSSLKAKIPYFREGLPPRLDFWGRPISYKSNLGDVYDAVSPIYSSDNTKANDVDREFVKIGYFPAHLGSIHMGGGRKVSLRNRPAAKNKWIELTAKTTATDLLANNDEDMGGANGRANRALRARLIRYGERTLYDVLDGVIKGKLDFERGGDPYAIRDNEGKAKIIRKIISDYRKVASIQTIREHQELAEAAAKILGRTGEEAQF